MREYLTADDICNQISMNRSVFKGTFLLAEGNTDLRLYSKFTEKDSVRIIPAHSKSNVIKAVNKMGARRDGKILGIVDRDIDELKGRNVSPPIFYTDYRDLEMMLITSTALEDALTEYGDPDRIDKFQRQYGPIRKVIIESSYPLGLLMYLSYLRGYNLNFKGLDFRTFIDKRTLRMDIQKMVQAVISNTYGSELSSRNVLKDLQLQMAEHKDSQLIARGHDTVDVLLIGLRDNFGSYNANMLNEGSLGGALRLAYDSDDFSSTTLYKESRKWAESRGVRLWSLNRT
jgi:hypothetical protein